jgi:hypothetical protein
VLSNDRSYWQPGSRTDTIDAEFRIHEDRVLTGTLSWATRAGRGTTTGCDTPLLLAGRYTCRWRGEVAEPAYHALLLARPCQHFALPFKGELAAI